MERWKQTDYNLSFSSSVVHHDLKMNSQGDKPEVFSDREGIEVVYPILPPGGEFVLTLATVGKTIDAENVTILHSKGSATDAFSGKREWGTMLSSAVLLLMTVLFWRRRHPKHALKFCSVCLLLRQTIRFLGTGKAILLVQSRVAKVPG